MIEITNTSREFNEVERYLMTVAPAIKSVKDVPDNTSIEVDGYLEFTDIKDDGTTAEILSIITPDMEVFSSQSKTFKRSLIDIANIMGDKKFAVVKISGVTNAGRPYVNCTLDTSSIK